MISRPPLIVAGMHRSATSLVASFLAAAGVDMGRHLVAADERNPRGYWEDSRFLELNRTMLAEAAGEVTDGWPDWGIGDEATLDETSFAPYRARAAELVAAASVSSAAAWGWKDPRTALALRFWREVCPGARFVLVFRDPAEVQASIERLGQPVFLERPQLGTVAWLRYNRALLDFAETYPDECLVVGAPGLLRRPDRVFELVRDRAGVALTGNPWQVAAQVADPGLLRPPPAAFSPAVPAELASESRELFAVLEERADIPARAPSGPRVSVVIPCLDDGAYLPDALASTAALDAEVLVVDDGSTDPATVRELDRVAAEGWAVRRVTHRGLPAARNAGFRLARHDYLVPLDADNRLCPSFVDRAVAALDRDPGLAAVYGDVMLFGGATGTRRPGPVALADLITDNQVDACAVIRRAAWADAGGYDEAFTAWEDWDLWLTMLERGWRLKYLPAPALEYRVRDGMLARLVASERQQSELRALLLRKHGPSFARHLPRVSRAWARSLAHTVADDPGMASPPVLAALAPDAREREMPPVSDRAAWHGRVLRTAWRACDGARRVAHGVRRARRGAGNAWRGLRRLEPLAR